MNLTEMSWYKRDKTGKKWVQRRKKDADRINLHNLHSFQEFCRKERANNKVSN